MRDGVPPLAIKMLGTNGGDGLGGIIIPFIGIKACRVRT
jgi:hypothetical protein